MQMLKILYLSINLKLDEWYLTIAVDSRFLYLFTIAKKNHFLITNRNKTLLKLYIFFK